VSPTRIGVVMAGGSGERFWPLSRPDRPKQLLRLTSPDETMLDEAVHRLQPLFGVEGTYVATSLPLYEPVLRHGIVAPDQLLAEPARRNTLGAQCWLIASLMARGLGDATVAVVTADHAIGDPDKFRGCVEAAMDVAEAQEAIVTIGVVPDRPETGYGYIEEDADGEIAAKDGRPVRRSKSFREKPSLASAQEFLDAGNFLWNAGMFFFTIPTFMRELKGAQPEAHATTLEVAEALAKGEIEAAGKIFERLPNISVDYAVMERAKDVYVVRSDFPWDDVGAWDAMERSLEADEAGNVVQGDVILIESTGSIIVNENTERVVGIVGLTNVVVVVSDNGVLVCAKDSAQNVRKVPQALASRIS